MQTGVGQSGMDPVFKRLKNIVSTFNRSPKAWACLQRKEREAGMERTKKLKQCIENRWGSEFDMVERFLEIQSHVNAALVEEGRASKALCADESKQLMIFKEETQVIRQLISSLQSQSEPLFPWAVCALNAVRKTMSEKIESGGDHERDFKGKEISKNFLRHLLLAMDSADHIRDVLRDPAPLTLAIAFMDPRYKSVIPSYYGVDSLMQIKETTESCVERFHLDCVGRDEDDLMCVEEPSIHPDVDKKKMMTDLANRMFADALVPPSTGEWERYLQQPLCDRTKENSLQWWKKKESEFPRLSKVARVLLSMSSSAVDWRRGTGDGGHHSTAEDDIDLRRTKGVRKR
jgi:hypothetical protein